MNPTKVSRERLRALTDLPNIGAAGAADFRLLGYQTPQELVGVDPFTLYERLCAETRAVHDPCVLDTFISVARFLAGEPPQVWWKYTAERKEMLSARKLSQGV